VSSRKVEFIAIFDGLLPNSRSIVLVSMDSDFRHVQFVKLAAAVSCYTTIESDFAYVMVQKGIRK